MCGLDWEKYREKIREAAIREVVKFVRENFNLTAMVADEIERKFLDKEVE